MSRTQQNPSYRPTTSSAAANLIERGIPDAWLLLPMLLSMRGSVSRIQAPNSVSLFGIDTLRLGPALGPMERSGGYTVRYRSIYRSIDLSNVVPIPYWARVPLLHISRIMQHGWLSQL